MCGIAGFAGLGDRDTIARMTNSLAHRGPDGEGYYHDDEAKVYLGHRRLAVVDIEGGHQPMWNEDRSVGVTFNGEIYNHVELRRELIARGHGFATDHSDTEALIHGYEEWGEDLPVRLNGMFAFAILDRRRGQLFLARDRFGEKPLVYAQTRGLFAFASEMRALAAHPGLDLIRDEAGTQKFFAHGYFPANETLFKCARKLEPGHWGRLNLDDLSFERRAYWRFRLEPDDTLVHAREEVLVEQLQDLLTTSVRRRLMSDVPIGLFLSGGLDSSAIAACASRLLPRGELRTFTIGFEDPSFDESAYARQVAEALGTRHQDEILSYDLGGPLLEQVTGAIDEPLGDASIVPTYLLSRFTRKHVTVALSGDGGDELFAGYDPFAALRPADLYSRVMPPGLHAMLRRAANWLPGSDANMSLDFKIKRTLQGLSYPPTMWNPAWMAPVEPAKIVQMFERPLPAEALYDHAVSLWNSGSGGGLVERTLEYFTNLYLPDDILVKIDRASMQFGLETRAVFLDNDLVEFCRRLPTCWKYRNGQRKYLLRKALEGWLPANILARKKKGFGMPLAQWLRTSPAAPPIPSAAGIETDWVAKCRQEHRAGIADHRLLLWSWLAFQSSVARYKLS
jgi:asparagine synthase (glutamine-hydrolysing)